MNKLREKLNSGECLLGTQMFLGSKTVAEILGKLYYDFIFVCAEHPAYDIGVVYDMVKYCQAGGTPALVRLPELDKTFTKKTVDMGVDGVLFSMIKNPEDANTAMSYCVYPPYGERGFGPMSAVSWGIESEAEFVKDNNSEGTVRMIQIEHVNAVDTLEEIVKNEYIDAYIFGPNDLASSMGHINDMYHPDVQAKIKQAIKVLQEHGKRFGVSLGTTDEKQIEYWKDLGMQIFSLGSDFGYVRDGATTVYNNLKDIIKK